MQARDFGPEDFQTLIALDENNVRVGVSGDIGRLFRKCPPVDYDCPICLDPMHTDRVMLRRCSHVFHERCIRPWLRDHHTCPIGGDELNG
jgi:hypothetical protein